MDTSKHRVTIPIEDYNELVKKALEYERQEDIISYIEGVLRSDTISEVKKYYRIRSAMNNWLPEHDLEDE